MNKQFKVLTYVPDEELENRINEASGGGKYVIKQMWRNKPFQGGVENTTVLMELHVVVPDFKWPQLGYTGNGTARQVWEPSFTGQER